VHRRFAATLIAVLATSGLASAGQEQPGEPMSSPDLRATNAECVARFRGWVGGTTLFGAVTPESETHLAATSRKRKVRAI